MQVDYVSHDGEVNVQAVAAPLAARDPSAQIDQQQAWGLGRISHRQPGVREYIDVAPKKTRTYILDTGIMINHTVQLPLRKYASSAMITDLQ